MNNYGAVSPNFWTGETGRKIRVKGAEAQLVALYLMTNKHRNALGLYYLPNILISHETALSDEGALKGLERLIEVGFCTFDSPSEVVWIYEMAKFQIAEELKEKDNRVKWINDIYQNLPKNPFLKPFFDKYKDIFHLKKARAFKAPPKPDSDSDSDSDTENKKSKAFSLPSKEEIEESSKVKLSDDLKKACDQLYKSDIFKEVYAFVGKMKKAKKNNRAILHTLSRCYLKAQQEPFSGDGAWGYCTKIIQVEDGNYNERDYIKNKT